MSDSSSSRPWIAVVAALGGLGAAIWLFAQAGRTGARTVAPPQARALADERLTAELVRPDEAVGEDPEAAPPASKEHPEWTTLRLAGRVLQADNERPLADIVVQVSGTEGRAVAGARSDEEGRFAIAARAPEEITVQALPRRGFVARDRPHAVTEAERIGAEEIVLRLARGTSAPVTGVVVNEHTEEGVFEVRIDVSGGELSESVVTDGNGSFATEVAFPPGQVSASVFDEPPGQPVRLDAFRREHLEDGRIGAPWELRVDIGPSYSIDSTAGIGLGPGFVARLVETDPEPRFAAVLEVYPGGFQLQGSEEDRWRAAAGGLVARPGWPETPVRAGTTPWIRYPKQVVEPPPEGTPREITLLVRGGGKWIGEARVSTSVGHYPYTVGIPLRACGVVSGTVVDTTAEPVKEAGVKLHSRGGGSDLPLYETRTNDAGAYSIADVDVGLYRLVIQPELHAGEERELRVEPGRNDFPTIILPPALVAGDVSGELFVAADTPHERPFLTLASAEGSSWREVSLANVAARDEHGTLYSFDFENVPSGEFDLTVGHLGRDGRGYGGRKGLSNFWSPRKLSVYPPRDGIRFTCTAPDDPEALVFRVTNTAGEPVPHADVLFGPEGFLVGQYELRGDRPFLLPAGVPLQWRVCANGYRPVRGTAADALRDEGRRVVEVVLQRGWGATLHVLAPPEFEQKSRRRRSLFDSELFWQATPVQTRVYADGAFVGRTDAGGRIDLSLPHMPARIGVEKDGWTGAAVVGMQSPSVEYTEAVLWLADFRKLLQQYGETR